MRVSQLLPEAEEELEAAASHYESKQVGLGAALMAEVAKTLDRVEQLPLAARAVREDLRRRFVRRFPFYVLYRVRNEEILIVAIATVGGNQVIGAVDCSRRVRVATTRPLAGKHRVCDPPDRYR